MTWRKASKSGDTAARVEAWRRSSSCDTYGDHCVEVAIGDQVLVRDSKDPDGPRLALSSGGWAAFLADIRAGLLDR